jgi:hypothetical protein
MNAAEKSARANIDAGTLSDMQRACSDETMRGILRDARAPQSPSSMIPSAHWEPPPERPSQIEPRPLKPPPGVALLDAQFNFLDQKEKAERAANLAAAERQAEAYRKFMDQAAKWDAMFAEFMRTR